MKKGQKTMMTNIKDILDKLHFKEDGYFEDSYYIIPLKDSDAYAKAYTTLNRYAVNTEYPDIAVNAGNYTTGVTNYFETEVDNLQYNISLNADFDKDVYTVKIGEK